MDSFIGFLKKTWKFLLGIAVAVIGGMLLFKKDDSGELIEESTEAAKKSFDDIITANEKREELEDKAIQERNKELKLIEDNFEKKKKKIQELAKKEVEKKLSNDSLEEATDLLAKELDALNLDKN